MNLSRVTIEELEGRVLLSASPATPIVPFYTVVLPPRSAAISPTPQFSGSSSSISPSQASAIDETGTASPFATISLHLHPGSPAEPLLVIVRPRLPEGSNLADGAGDGGTMSVVESADVDSTAYAGQFSAVGAPSEGDAGGYQSAPTVAASPAGAEWATFSSEGAVGAPILPESADGQNLATAIDSKRYEVAGTLDTDQMTVTFNLPILSMDESMGLSLRGIGPGGGGIAPAFGQLELFNPDNVPIEQSSPPPGSGPGMVQALTVMLRNATAGSRLQVQILPIDTSSGNVSASNPGETSLGAASSGANSSSSVSFVLSIQRQDYVLPVNDEGGANLPTSAAVGTLVVAPTNQSGSSSISATWAAAEPAETLPSEESAVTTTATTTIATGSETTELPSDSLDDFNIRVLTGPLASRTASPLGPTLASIDAEATQQVDRRERALDQAIEGVDHADGEPSVAWRPQEAENGSTAAEASRLGRFGVPGSNDGPVIDVLGNGGYPMKVTAHGRSQGADLSALWATLPSLSEAERAGSTARESEIAKVKPGSSDRPSDAAETPNYFKAACGLAFGIMMTSGPLFPDLIARLSRRTPRWILNLRARTGRPGSAGPGRLSLAKVSSWLRGRLLWP